MFSSYYFKFMCMFQCSQPSHNLHFSGSALQIAVDDPPEYIRSSTYLQLHDYIYNARRQREYPKHRPKAVKEASKNKRQRIAACRCENARKMADFGRVWGGHTGSRVAERRGPGYPERVESIHAIGGGIIMAECACT